MSQPTQTGAAPTPRVAFYCNLMGWPKSSSGGVRQWVLALANGLVERGIAVDVLTEAPAGRFKDEPLLDARVGRVLLGRRGWGATRRLRDYVRRHPGVRVIAALNEFNLRAVALKPHFGSAVHITVSQHEHLSGDGAWRKKLKYWWTTRAITRGFNRADAVVAVSQGVADDLNRQFSVRAELLHAIYNPAYSDALVERARGSVDHPWLTDKTLPVVVAMGRLHPVKGYDHLLDAFAQLLLKRQARLLILGEGRVRADLQAQVERLGIGANVQLPGRVSNVGAWLARADVFAMTSLAEGFGNVLVEALACGLRIVATRCPGGPSEILENGRWARMVEVADIAGLAEALALELDTPPQDQAARLARARYFSLERALDGYCRVWGFSLPPGLGD